MPSYILRAIATGHACCFDAPNDFVAREKAYSELRQIALALYPPSTNGTYAIRRRVTGSLTLDYTSRTTMDGMLEIVRGFDFDVEDFGEDSSVEGYVEFLYETVTDICRLERLRAALPEHATLHAEHEAGDLVGKARISFIVEGHEYDPPEDAVETLLEVLLSDEVPPCTDRPARGEGECNGEGHDLWAPIHIVGGHEANPGVFGLKNGVLLERKVCLNCACTLETTINSATRPHGVPECEIRVLQPSDASTTWAKGKREEFRRMQPVPFTVGDLERVLDLIDLVRAGNTDVMHLEDEAQAMWNWLLSYMPPSPPPDDGKI